MKILGFSMTAACVAGALCLAPQALSQAPKGDAVLSSMTVTATVTKINQKTREVTVKADDGQKYTFVADEAVANLPQVKKGDVITVTYTEALAWEVKKGGTAGAGAAAGAAAAPIGAKPAAGIAGKVTLTVKIAAIDPRVPSVTFKAADGESKTIKVKHPEELQGVSVGDTVGITYTEALAIKVEAKPKK
jgi:hypothetical protein